MDSGLRRNDPVRVETFDNHEMGKHCRCRRYHPIRRTPGEKTTENSVANYTKAGNTAFAAPSSHVIKSATRGSSALSFST